VETTQYEESRLNSVLFDLDADIDGEYEDTIDPANLESEDTVLSVLKASKTFTSKIGGTRSDHRALDTISFHVKKGMLP
jgi:ABC-type glutathione transport system ATPase component